MSDAGFLNDPCQRRHKVTTQDGGRPLLTTETGAPVADNQNSETAGRGGPLLVQDQQLFEKLARFNRERIPERIVHARGAGAYGTFTVTADVTTYTRAAFLSEIGKQTEVFVRFSTVAGSLGSADAVRDSRGFAIKFYTEEGNYDLIGNKHPDLLHQGPEQIRGLHPHPEARPPHRLTRAGQRMGLLGPEPGVHPSGHLALR